MAGELVPRTEPGEPPGWGLDLLPRTADRIRIGFAVLGVAFLFVLVVAVAARPGHLVVVPFLPLVPQRGTLIVGAALGFAAALVVWASSRRMSTLPLVRVALAAETVLVMSVGLVTNAFLPEVLPVDLSTGPHGVFGWGSILIAIYPLVVPSDVRRVLLVSSFSALMVPVSYRLQYELGLALGYSGKALAPLQTGSNYGWLLLWGCLGSAAAVYFARQLRSVVEHIERIRQTHGYELREFDEGGMGTIWLAEHGVLGVTHVAKSVRLDPSSGDDFRVGANARAHLLREAQRMASLQSHHAVAIHNAWISDDNALFLAMEYVRGFSLGHFYGRTLPAGRVAHLLAQVCDVLVEAHSKGIVHSDLKPGNIMIGCYDGEADFVKVLDFGIAQIVGSDDFREVADAPSGSLPYMAPEQYARAPADPRMDLFSVGCVAYALLAGAPPFDARTPPSTRPRPEPLPSVVPDELAAIVLQCMAADPGERPQGAAELAARFRRIRDACAWSADDSRRWWNENA